MNIRSRTRKATAAGVSLTVTAGILAVAIPQAQAAGIPKVTNLRYATHSGFDRAVIDLTSSGAKVRTAWVDKARNCATGNVHYVPGKKFLEVVVEPAQAHNDKGQNTYVGPGRKASAWFGLPNLKGVRMTCDFEGQVSWVLGFDHKAKVSTGKLTGPNRIYVDIKH